MMIVQFTHVEPVRTLTKHFTVEGEEVKIMKTFTVFSQTQNK